MLQERLARVYVSDTMPVMCKFNNKMETVPVFFFFFYVMNEWKETRAN